MVFYDHEVAYVIVVVNAACRIGNEQVFDADYNHDACGQGDHFHGIALIIMDTSLHCDNGLAAE